MSLTIQLPFSIEQELRVQAAQNGVSLEKYVAQMIASGVSDAPGGQQSALSEDELLLRINSSTISQKDLQRFRSLDKRRKAEKLTAQEQEELVRLVHRIEIAHAERLKWVAALSTLRKIPLHQLLVQLGIKPAQGNEK